MRLSISNIAWDVAEDEAIARLLKTYHVNAIDIAPGKYFPDPHIATSAEIASVRQWWADRMAFVNQRISALPESVVVIDPAEVLCDDRFCYAGTPKDAHYFDDDHLSLSGVKLVVNEVVKVLNSGTNR